MKKRSCRTIAAMLAVLMLLPILLCVSSAKNNSVSPSEGVFRIRNAKTGEYLTAYLNASRGEGKAYMAPLDKNNEAQIFLLRKTDGGSYVIWPQNDTSLYCFAYSKSTSAGSPVVKLLTEDERAHFDILELRSGACTIAPAGGDSQTSAIGISDDISYYSDDLVEFLDYKAGDGRFEWYFEPVLTEAITMAFTNTDVKLYSTGRFYARLKPYNYMQERVEWTSSNEDVLMVGELGMYTALSLGTATVTAAVDGVKKSFRVTVTDKAAFTWYSQRSTQNSDWDSSILTDLYFWSGGVKLRYAADYRNMSVNSWMREGCAICSVAMVLHNLGAVLERGYDLRSGQTGNLPADPYTVTLANTYNFGPTSTAELLYGDPILASWNAIASRFFVDGKAVGCRKIYYPSPRRIADLLEDHPAGIVVEFRKSSGSHYVVFGKCLNPEAKNQYDLEFEVYDPLGYTADQGDGVSYERTASYLVGGFGMGTMYSAMIYDLADRVG